MAVPEQNTFPADLRLNIPVVVLDLLHFRRWFPVAKADAISAEVAVVGAVVEVPSISVYPASISVTVQNALIDIIPDKAALISRFFIRVFRIPVHRAVGVAHAVRILAEDEGLFRMFFQKCPDFSHRRIHLAVHIRGVHVAVRPSVIADSLIMHQTGIIQPAEFVAHLQDYFSAVALVSTAPNQDRWMILISFCHAVYPVEQHRQIFHAVSGQALRRGQLPFNNLFPDAMGFHVAFINDVKPQLVAQFIQHAAVRIMTRPDGIQIVPFHCEEIPPQGFRFYGASRLSAEIMPVSAFENNPFPVQQHESVFHLEPAESDPLVNPFANGTVRCHDFNLQIIQIRDLRTPLPRADYRHGC